MNKFVQPVLITLSVFALLNVMFVPIFDVWGGLFPSDVDYNFFDVLKMISKDGGDAWDYWVVQFTITIFVPSLIMFVASLTGSKGFFVTVNVIGILLWIRQIVYYGMDNDFDGSFDFDDGNVSIGTWIAIGIFVISLIIALSSRKSIPNTTHQPQPQTYQPPLETNHPPMPQQDKVIICPKCGSKMAGGSFCTNCGTKLF